MKKLSSIRIKKQKIPFTQISNKLLQDTNLSWKARGLLVYLLSLPDDWDVYIKDLVNRAPDGYCSVVNAIEEMEKQGYLKRKRKTNGKGHFIGHEYLLKMPKNPECDFPNQGFPNQGFPNQGNPSLTNKQLRKKTSEDRKETTQVGTLRKRKDATRNLDIKISSVELKLAHKLNEKIRQSQSITRRVRDTTWEKQIIELYSKRNYSKKLVLSTIQWYIKNYGKEYIPKLYNTKLQDVFPRILTSKEIDEKKHPAEHPAKKTKLSSAGKFIFKEIQKHGFPKVTDEELCQAIEQSIANFAAYCQLDAKYVRMLKSKQKKKLNANEDDFEERIIIRFSECMRGDICGVHYFIAQWFIDILRKLVLYNNWNGSLKNQIFHFEHDRFIAFGRAIAEERGDKYSWPRYIKALRKLNSGV